MTNYNKITIVEGDTYSSIVRVSGAIDLSDLELYFTSDAITGYIQLTKIEGDDAAWRLSLPGTLAPGSYTYDITGILGSNKRTCVYRNTLTVLRKTNPLIIDD